MPLLAVVDVGAEIVVARVPGQVGEHGKRLHAEIGVGLEPETVDVLRELDAEIGPLEIGAADLLDMVGDALVLIGLSDRLANGKALAVLDVEIFARVVVQFALARDAVERRRIERKGENVVDGVGGEAVPQGPEAIGLFDPFGAVEARDEVAHGLVRRTSALTSGRMLYGDAVPHERVISL